MTEHCRDASGATSGSLARRLSLSVGLSSLALTLAALALALAVIFHTIRVHLEEQADYSLALLTDSLAVPLWSLDLEAARAIGRALAQDESVELLEISGSRGESLFLQTKGGTLLLERQAPVLHGGQTIGSVRLGLNNTLQRQAFWTVSAIGGGFTAMTVCLHFLFQAFLFKPLLRRPFASLTGWSRPMPPGTSPRPRPGPPARSSRPSCGCSWIWAPPSRARWPP